VQIRLTFLGAARNVTGSRYLLETDGARILVDCGLFQEREYKSRNWEPFSVPPNSIDAILLTHAHLDHCGLIPKICREGFRGSIYCTDATADIAKIMLLDAAKLQEEDALFKRRRHGREGRRGPYPEIPLYTVEDARASLNFFSHPVRYENPVKITDTLEAIFYDAGHVLGSSMIKLTVSQGGEKITILFSGDVGRWHIPILRDPSLFAEADYVILESTYGDRLHGNSADIADDLAEIINSTWKAGGNIVIPSFALERAQEVLYYLNRLLIGGRIPHLPVFLDSPMAISVTEVFKTHSELYDREMTRLVGLNKSPFDFPGLKMAETVDDSKAINHFPGTAIIIAGSGMCTGGRIKHHLVNNIARPESTILFVGYQAQGTLGRQIVDGNKRVRILGQYYPVRANIVQLSGFSAHADRDELMRWLSGFKEPPKRLFVTHGESEVADSFSAYVRERMAWEVSVPEYREQVLLN
jgi:metallo-beta-lactamase family protein